MPKKSLKVLHGCAVVWQPRRGHLGWFLFFPAVSCRPLACLPRHPIQENDKSPKSVVGDIVRLGGGEVGGFRGLRVASCQAQEAIPIFPASSFLQLALTLALVAAQRRSLSRSLDAKKKS